MTEMICLANSIRQGARCVAGIEVETGRWIRPVPPGGGGIPNEHVYFDGHLMEPLDIVQLIIQAPHLKTKYQRENCVMPAYGWKIIGKAHPQQLMPCCDRTVPILHTPTDRVDPSMLDGLAPEEWTSLQLVRANPVIFERDYFDRKRWRAEFSDEDDNHYSLKITDATICDRLIQNDEIDPDCLLTISLAEPWTHNITERLPACYKVVASVIEL